MKLSCHYQFDRFDLVQYVMKTRQDNNMIDRTGVINVENDNELSWPIRSGVDCDENNIGQLCD